jgi:hypothetical protein
VRGPGLLAVFIFKEKRAQFRIKAGNFGLTASGYVIGAAFINKSGHI